MERYLYEGGCLLESGVVRVFFYAWEDYEVGDTVGRDFRDNAVLLEICEKVGCME